MNFLGLDLSLNSSGVVVLDDSCVILFKETMCPPNGCKNVERLFFLTNLFIEFLSKYDITYCCIESPAYGSEAGHLFELGEWAGIVKLELFKKGIPFMLVAPNQLKKYVSGSGQSKKQTIILDVYKNFGEEIRQDDIADAYVLARISRDYFVSYEKDVVIQFQEYQKEVLKALRKKYEEQTELL